MQFASPETNQPTNGANDSIGSDVWHCLCYVSSFVIVNITKKRIDRRNLSLIVFRIKRYALSQIHIFEVVCANVAKDDRLVETTTTTTTAVYCLLLLSSRIFFTDSTLLSCICETKFYCSIMFVSHILAEDSTT